MIFKEKLTEISESFFYFIVWSYLYITFMVIPLLFYKVRFEGVENLPKGGRYVIAANHQNFFDGLLPACIFGPIRKICFLVSKKSLKNKMFLLIARLMGSVIVDSDVESIQKAFEELHKTLNKNGIVVIFPEGKVSSKEVPSKFKGGVAKLSIDAQVAVVPAYLKGTYELRYFKKWFKSHEIIFKIGKPIELYKIADEYNYNLESAAEFLREQIISLSGIGNAVEIEQTERKSSRLGIPLKIYENKINEPVA